MPDPELSNGAGVLHSAAPNTDEIAEKEKRETIIREGLMQLSTLLLADSTTTPLKPHASAPAEPASRFEHPLAPKLSAAAGSPALSFSPTGGTDPHKVLAAIVVCGVRVCAFVCVYQ